MDNVLVSEIIGHSQESHLWRQSTITTVDRTVADYEFWDQLRRGFLPGYEFGALFCNPMSQIVASYVLGDGVELHVRLDRKGNLRSSEIRRLVERILQSLKNS